MSLNNTSPPLPVAVSVPIGTAFTVSSVGVKRVNATKSSEQTPVVYQASKLSVASGAVTQNSALFVQDPSQDQPNAATTVASTMVAAVSTTKSIISTPTIVSIAQPAKPTTSHGSKPLGKHQLPVRPLPGSGISHVLPRSSSNATAPALIDPGGGSFASKAVALPSSIISASAKTKVAPQHVFMAPGLRSPAPPTLKLQPHFPSSASQSFSSVAYHIPNQQSTTSLAGKPIVSVTTPRIQQPLLVRSIYPQHPTRPVTIATSLDGPRRPSSVVYQPTTTLSISVPARPSSHHDTGLPPSSVSRITVPAQGVKSVYQVGIAQPTSVSSLAVSTAKVSKKVVAQRPGAPVLNNATTRPVSIATCATSTAVSAVSSFTYSAASTRLASISSITTSPVPVTKVYTQPQSAVSQMRGSEGHQTVPIGGKQPPASGATTAQATTSVATVVTSLPSSRGVAPMMSPHMLYWQHPAGINLNPTYPASTPNSYASLPSGIRLPGTAPSPAAPIRINPPLLVMDSHRMTGSPGNVAAFTQGQAVLQTITSTPSANPDQARLLPSHHATNQAAILPQQSSHVTNMSPKPAILRRPVRNDSITKKLFVSEPRDRPSQLKAAEHRPVPGSVPEPGSNVLAPKGRYSSTELVYTQAGNIKPVLPGQVTFTKSTVTSNGLTAGVKLQNNGSVKDYSIGTLVKSEHGGGHLPRQIHQVAGEQKIKTEPNYASIPFSVKTEPASHIVPHLYQSNFPSPPGKLSDNSAAQLPRPSIHPHGQPIATKVRLQQRSVVTLANPPSRGSTVLMQRSGDGSSPSLVATAHQARPASVPGPTHTVRAVDVHTEHKIKLGPSGAVKRPYDCRTMTPDGFAGAVGAEPLTSQAAARAEQQSPIGLSPRKKPRKQTHVVAEEFPDTEQMIDEEMSTDDADECEDEQPLSSTSLPEEKVPSHEKTDSSKPAAAARTETETTKTKPEAASSSKAKSLSEYTDEDGVRYVAVRARPPFSLLNGHRARPVTNHFTHYSDVKVKEKKITFHDQSFNPEHMDGWKVSRLAMQFDELMSLDADALKRIERIKCDLLDYCRSVLGGGGGGGDSFQEPGGKSPAGQKISPTGIKTPTLATPFSKNFSSRAADAGNSPLTPSERRASRFREEILKIEEMAQANIQRCSVMQEQLSEVKGVFVKVLDCRDLALKLVAAGREVQKPSKSLGGNGSRGSKKKKS